MNPEEYKQQLEARQVALMAQQEFNAEGEEDAVDLANLVNGGQF